jgi:uncharacterized protein (TIGR04255 family)
MDLPLRISPCPIREANIELRFEANVPADAVFGILYNALKDSYKDPVPTPVTQLPSFVIDSDPNLQYQAHYKISRDNYLLQVGPRVIALAVVGDYPGWREYRSEALSVFRVVEKLDFVFGALRFGLRYINTFDLDIFEKIRLQITQDGESVSSNESYLRLGSEIEGLRVLLQVANEAMIKTDDGVMTKGSLIDIDVSFQPLNGQIFQDIEDILDRAHQIEKRRFFELLKHDYLEELNPMYAHE